MTTRFARGTEKQRTIDPQVARALVLLEARASARNGDHKRASELFASIGYLYVVEVQIPEGNR